MMGSFTQELALLGCVLRAQWRRPLVALAMLVTLSCGGALVAVVLSVAGCLRASTSGIAPDRWVILRQGSGTELRSFFPQRAASSLRALLSDQHARALRFDTALAVVVRDSGAGRAHATLLRGLELVPDSEMFQLTAGRLPQAGARELLVGSAARELCACYAPGAEVRLGNTAWRVVGEYRIEGAPSAVELWTTAADLSDAFRMGGNFSSARFTSTAGFAVSELQQRIDRDPALGATVMGEREYAERSIGTVRAFVYGFGAILIGFCGLSMALGMWLLATLTYSHRREMHSAFVALGFELRCLQRAATAEGLLIGGLGSGLALLVFQLAIRGTAIPGFVGSGPFVVELVLGPSAAAVVIALGCAIGALAFWAPVRVLAARLASVAR